MYNEKETMDTIKLPNPNDIKEKKSFFLKMDSLEERDGYAIVKGYGAVKGNIDQGDDMIVNGAFSKTEQERKGKVVFLQDHIPSIDHTLGVTTFSEDDYGLFCEFEINLSKEKGREAYALAKQLQEHGMQMGLSIGFAIPKGKSEYVELNNKSVRLIKEVILYEVSMTNFPMNDMARVNNIKSLLDIYENYTYVPTSLVKKVANSSIEEPVDTSVDLADAKLKEELLLMSQELKTLKQKLSNGYY